MYYVFSVSDDEVLGPYSLIDLVTFIQPGILVCEESNENWQYAEDIPAIKEIFIELGLTEAELPDGYIMNENGEYVRKQEEVLPAGFRVNSFGELIRNTQVTNTPPENDRDEEVPKKNNYIGWIIFVIIIILIIIAANGGFD